MRQERGGDSGGDHGGGAGGYGGTIPAEEEDYREGEGLAVEEVSPYGPNVLSFEVVSGRRRWYIIRCYLAPDDARTIERVVTALGDQPRGTALIVAGDLNNDLGDM